jgi:catechol 2,3-dioxygenase-like lactoylglutathione lyase family enzyme
LYPTEHAETVLNWWQKIHANHICFVLDAGLEDLYKRLDTQGVDIAMSLRKSPPKDALMCFIRDNTGNLIELIQMIE